MLLYSGFYRSIGLQAIQVQPHHALDLNLDFLDPIGPIRPFVLETEGRKADV